MEHRGSEREKEKTPAEIIICSVTNLLCIQIEMRELNTQLSFMCVCARFQCSNRNNKIQRRSPLRLMDGWDAWCVCERGEFRPILMSLTQRKKKKKKKLNCSMKKDKRFYIKIRLNCRDKNDEMITHTAWQLRNRRRRRQMAQSMKMK